MILLTLGCMSLDGFYFNPGQTSQYGFPSDVIPADAIEEVVFESDDGTTLYGMWAWQDQPWVAPGTLVYFHGNSSTMDEYMPHVGALWSLGYNVFTFDYRGYGRSEGSPTHDGVLADGVAAIDVAVDQGPVPDAGALAYVGLSLGGFVSIHASADRPPRALITQDMFSSGDALLELNSGMDIPAGWVLEDAFDNVAAAQALDDVPLLILHGDSDTYIKPENGELVYDAAHEPKRLVLMPGADHGQSPFVDPERYGLEITDWLETWPRE